MQHVTPAKFARKMRELKTEDLRVALLKTTLMGLGYGEGLEIMQEAETVPEFSGEDTARLPARQVPREVRAKVKHRKLSD